LINFQLGSLVAAEESLRKVVAQAPADVGARRALALTYLRMGRPAVAVETLGPALQARPDDPVLLRVAGEAYLASGNPGNAARAYERANALDKGNVASKVRLAQARYAAGDTARAFTDLESLSKADNSQFQADLALIAGHIRRREFDQALAAAKQLEAKQPNNPLTYNVKGTVYLGMRDFASARAAYEKALQIQPTDFVAAHALGLLDIQQRKVDDARKRYEQMLSKDPNNEQLLLALAELLAMTKHPPEEVKAAIDKAIVAAPTSVRPRMALITYYLKLPDPKAALNAAQTAQSAMPNTPPILEALAAAQLATGATNQALETYRRVAQLQPENPAPLMRMSDVQAGLKDYNAAIETLQKVLKLQPDFAQAQVRIAQLYVISGRPELALTEARTLQKQQPDRAVGYTIEAEVLAYQKKWMEAVAAYRNAIAKEPLPILAIRAYVALDNAGKANDATALATKWMKDHPKDLSMQMFLGQQSLGKKDYRAAAGYYRSALEIEPNNVAVLNNLAWVLTQLGDPKATEVAERAYLEAPNDANVMDTFGWALVQKGNPAKGQELLRAASNLAPGNDEIRLHLAAALLKNGDKAAARLELETLIKRDKATPIRDEATKMLEGI
jgi:cellulose synthase operon protein C